MKIVVLGAGAVGAYYGGQLARVGHEVTCFARGASLTAIRERGLEIRMPEDAAFRPRVAATDRVEELGPAEFGILAVNVIGGLVVVWPIDAVLLLRRGRRQRLGDLAVRATVRRVSN